MKSRIIAWCLVIGSLFFLWALISLDIHYSSIQNGKVEAGEWGNKEWELTVFERQARPIVAALEAYHEKHHEYPQDLAQLEKEGFIRIIKPLIGQKDWVFQGAADAFILAVKDQPQSVGYERFYYDSHHRRYSYDS